MIELCGARTILKEKPVGRSIKSPEATNGDIKRFTSEAKAGLEKQGYKIIPLTGKSIEDYKNGKRIQSTWHDEYERFVNTPSIKSEVAINLNEIFLTESYNETFSKQKDITKNHEDEVRKQANEVKVIIGRTPDNLEIMDELYKLSDEKNGIGDVLREGSARCSDSSPYITPAIKQIMNREDADANAVKDALMYHVTIQMDSNGIVIITGLDTGRAKPKVGIIPVIVPEDLPV